MNAIVEIARSLPETTDVSLENEDRLFEIVNGQEVEIPHMGALSSMFAFRLAKLLDTYGERTSTGQAAMEILFPLGNKNNRRPDVAFVSFERWPRDRVEGLDQNAWPVVPDLAVEVVSKHDEMEPLLEKLEEYFDAGVRQVWIVIPKKSVIYVYDSFTQVRIVGRNDTLEGGAVLPGFSLVLKDLFPETLAQLPRGTEDE